jgi:hypothetical protein
VLRLTEKEVSRLTEDRTECVKVHEKKKGKMKVYGKEMIGVKAHGKRSGRCGGSRKAGRDVRVYGKGRRRGRRRGKKYKGSRRWEGT